MPDHSGTNVAEEPIAIIGIGCHFPGGATTPRAFWQLLTNGVDATRDVPEERWEVRKFYDPDPQKSGKMNTFHGGYLDRIDQFDAAFFGVSPREAVWLDPQQRLLMRVAWEAMEDGGQVPTDLAGSDTGVFIGGFTLDYQLLQNYGVYSRYQLQSHSATGMMMTMLANRLSYVFDFRGPSMAVDTACSASLVATHLAVKSLRDGECSLALVGGANVMIAPNMTIAESKGGFLSSDGRCKTFDSSADGYARGEGAAVVVLKPLSRARADGDPIYAVIRGSAVTQDGHTNGITVPNGEAQQAAMRAAYQRAGIAPRDIQYIEAHGTGTPVGDPIEVRAIGSVLSTGRGDQPCLVGSVKTNIGHLEAAAGVAGLIKASLAIRHGQIPPHLHLRAPHPDIPFEELKLRVPTTVEPWPETAGPRRAGVNSFGFGGTNAHVVLEQAPEPSPRVEPAPVAADAARPFVLPLSARSPESLASMAGAYRDLLLEDGQELADIGYSASRRRAHHDHRLAVVASDATEAAAKLDAFVQDTPQPGVVAGRVPPTGRPKIAFVCSGMGPQWWAMARELLATEPVFHAAVRRCDAEFAKHAGWSLLAAMNADEDSSRMAETEVAQPANFAVQVGLAALWESWGVTPDAVVGHSTGEVAAQYLTGVLSFEDAVKVTYYRSSLQQRTTGQGRMLAVGLTAQTLNLAVRDAGPQVSVAAVNSPNGVTLAGDAATLENMAAQLETFGVFHRFLQVKVPYHSHFMDPLRDDLLAGLADLSPRSARMPLYSTVTGTRIDGAKADANYWWQNVRGTVLFAAAAAQMVADGYTVFVELSPHPVLAASLNEILADQGQQGVVVPSLRRRESDQQTIRASLGRLYTLGADVAWSTFYGDDRRFRTLPPYPWHLKTYWTESPEAREDRHYQEEHPLLGQRLNATHPTWERELGAGQAPFLADHRVQDGVVVPGAALLEMAQAAGRAVYGAGDHALEDIRFIKALVLPPGADPRVRTVLHPEHATVEISSYLPTAGGPAQWTLNVAARLRSRRAATAAVDLAEFGRGCDKAIDRDAFYEHTTRMGFQYGPAFQAVEHVDAGPGLAVGRVRVPDTVGADLDRYRFHPSLVDAAFQVLLVAAGRGTSDGEANDAPPASPYLPVAIDRLRLLGPPATEMRVVAEVVEADERHIVSDIRITDPDGTVLVEVEGFTAQSLDASVRISTDRIDRSLYELAWLAQPLDPPADAATEVDAGTGDEPPAGGGWLIFADRGGVGEALARRVRESGVAAVTVAHAAGGAGTPLDGESAVLDPTDADQFRALFTHLGERGPLTHIVHLWALDAEFGDTAPLAALDADQRLGPLSIMHMLQALSHGGAQLPRVHLVTRRAQPVGDVPTSLSVTQASVWGLGRVVGHQEFKSMWGGLVDLDESPVTQQADELYAEIRAGGGPADGLAEDQVAFRDGQRYVARLVEPTALTPALPVALRPDGAYLVTGGLGALGLLVARYLVRHGARHLVLMGRTPVPERDQWGEVGADDPRHALIGRLLELERLGAAVHLATVDVADEEQLTSWLDRYDRQARPPIRGVVHAAGVVADELLLRMSTETFEKVLRPKVRGGWLMHRLFRDRALDFFVLFSSVGAVIASPGQGNYAAGNAFLDALAHHRQSLGLPALSIGWGPWSIGMVEQLNLEQLYTRRGIELITPEAGMQTLGRVLGQRPAYLTAIGVDWAVARQSAPAGNLPAMFSRLGVLDAAESEADDPDPSRSLLAELRTAAPGDRLGLVADHLRDMVARVLQLDPGGLTGEESLSSLGMDSMLAIEVKQRVEAVWQADVSVLDLLQGATIAGLAARIVAGSSFEDVAVPDGADANAEAVPAPTVEAQATELEQLLAETTDEELELLLSEIERDQVRSEQ
ncbi:type I polyketide synthase [Micromonospora sp. WMMA1998]|uniref:type I polyketide synthase n=1 Tax=Micromonospora sp. WMMA1998 TaxID=3015167 RepID=UPI00248CD2F7|nr:type I polyketide synthase [Micromonospora sp. WMMA1998]WBC14939.1 type I polyketide synthase [Micromonospora sp. WMMA1998]